jgi:hypothetical protein
MSARPLVKRLAAAAADRAPWLIDLYRAVVQPRWEAANRRDARLTLRALGWLRDLPEPPPTADAALLVLRREDVFDVKTHLMLGAALKLEGVRPVVFANYPRVARIRRYARAFGVHEMVYRSQFPLAGDERRRLEARAAELLARPDDLAAVREWKHDGHRLGDRVLSTLIRETLIGHPDLNAPDVRRRLGRIVALALANYAEAEAVLAAVAPRWVLADETGYAVNGPLVDVALARGLDVFETSPFVRDNSLMLKRMNATHGRAAAASVSAATLERLEAADPEGRRTAVVDAEVLAEIESRYTGGSALQAMYQRDVEATGGDELKRRLGLDDARPVVVVFTHVLWDASFFYGDDLFLDFQEWLEETLRAAVANPRAQWLIKTHPSNAFRLQHGDIQGPVAEVEVVRQTCGELPGHVRLLLPETKVSSLDLYRHADVGVTVRGTPGLEMACLGKPVLTAGSGHYSGLGFTVDSASREEFLACLGRVETLTAPPSPLAVSRARRYAHALFRLRPWMARSFELRMDFPAEGWHPLDRNVLPVATSLAEAERFGDLHRWAAWAIDGDAADYLDTVPGEEAGDNPDVGEEP